MAFLNKILLVLQDIHTAEPLHDTLTALDISNIHTLHISQDIHAFVETHQPEAIIIETEQLDPGLLDHIRTINHSFQIPVILFTDSNEDKIIEQAIKSGVATYIVGTLDPRRIRTILQVAITRYAEIQKLKQDLSKTKAQLEERKLIDKAKGLLMQHKQISEDQAYQALRKMAMDKNKRISEIAEGIISTFDLLAWSSGSTNAPFVCNSNAFKARQRAYASTVLPYITVA